MPTANLLDGQLVLVLIVDVGRCIAIVRACTLLVIGIGVVVPVHAVAFIAAILHGPHGMLARLVDVEHLATILSLVDVEHLTGTCGTPAVRVVLVTDSDEFFHVVAADALVAAFVEEDGGIVAVIDDGIAHQFRALCPVATYHILLGIAGRHGLNEAHTVTRLHVLSGGGDVHPAYEVTSRLHQKVVAVVGKPSGYVDAHRRPLVRGALRIAMYHDDAVVEPHLALAKLRLAEASASGHLVNGGAVDH